MEALKKECHFDTIEEVLNDAMTAPKEDYFIYEKYKRMIWDLSVSCDEYQEDIKKLTEILKV